MRIRKKTSTKVLPLHVLVEQNATGFRAYCLEFDLAVSGANQEQTMVRLEKIVKTHINYAVTHKSNPVHPASPEVNQRWFSESTVAPLKKSYILEVHFASQRNGVRTSSFRRKTRKSFEQLACA